jgi:hypothetical protein
MSSPHRFQVADQRGRVQADDDVHTATSLGTTRSAKDILAIHSHARATAADIDNDNLPYDYPASELSPIPHKAAAELSCFFDTAATASCDDDYLYNRDDYDRHADYLLSSRSGSTSGSLTTPRPPLILTKANAQDNNLSLGTTFPAAPARSSNTTSINAQHNNSAQSQESKR